jgi:diacylglycerol kinase family enzyme
VIGEMQAINLVPEVYLIEQGCDLLPVIRDALQDGIRLFVVCGGDGTIDTVAGALIDTSATLGIVPTGTQNNVALSLGIPADIPTAVSLLRTGEHLQVDIGLAICDDSEHSFLEACSVGLLSALFPAADDIQHGNLARIGDLLSTLVSFPAAEMRLNLDDQREIRTQGHVVLAANMPYTGPHYLIDPEASFQDGLLDVLVFANQSKLDLLTSVVQLVGGGVGDPRIQHFHVRTMEIETDPPMPILVDGFPLGDGPLRVQVKPGALSVMAGSPASILERKNQEPEEG